MSTIRYYLLVFFQAVSLIYFAAWPWVGDPCLTQSPLFEFLTSWVSHVLTYFSPVSSIRVFFRLPHWFCVSRASVISLWPLRLFHLQKENRCSALLTCHSLMLPNTLFVRTFALFLLRHYQSQTLCAAHLPTVCENSPLFFWRMEFPRPLETVFCLNDLSKTSDFLILSKAQSYHSSGPEVFTRDLYSEHIWEQCPVCCYFLRPLFLDLYRFFKENLQ